MVQSPDSSSVSLEVWLNRYDGAAATWERQQQNIALPPGSGQILLADFDADGDLGFRV